MDVNEITLPKKQIVRLATPRPLIQSKQHFIERTVIMLTNSTIKAYMKYQTGLTLVELLIALAVVSVLLALAAPRFGTMTTANKVAATANALATDIAYTRNEAVTRNGAVTITAKAGDWSQGWQIIADPLGAGTILRDVDPISSTITLTNPSGITNIAYQSNGSQTSGTVDIKFCDNNRPAGNNGTTVSVIPSGRSSVEIKTSCP